jgi:hypothetical protein
MALRTTFAPLFHLRVFHEAKLDLGVVEWAALPSTLRAQRMSAYNLGDDLLILPTRDCLNLLKQHRLKLRHNPFGLTIYAEVIEDPDDPASVISAHPLEDSARLRFSLELANPSFPSAANLPLDGLTGRTLYLSNSHQHSASGELHLTRKLPVFDPAKSYRAGDLVVDNDANPSILLEATENLAPSPSPGNSDWLRLPASPFSAGNDYQIEDQVMHQGILYEAASSGTHPQPPSAEWTEVYRPSPQTGVGAADFVAFLGPGLGFKLSAGVKFAKAKLFDSDNQEIKSFTFYHETGEDLQDLLFDLGEFESGFYRIEAVDSSNAPLTGFPHSFYYDALNAARAPFGLVEIFNQPGTHAIIDGNGHLPAPIFHVRFRKRHTFWRYQFLGDLKGFPPADTGDLEQSDPGDDSKFVSNRPLPLTTGSISLQKFGDILRLPNPDIAAVKPEGSKLYSDNYIHI